MSDCRHGEIQLIPGRGARCGICGTTAWFAAPPSDAAAPLDVERLADAFTWFHIRTAGMCAGSHRDEAREYAALKADR